MNRRGDETRPDPDQRAHRHLARGCGELDARVRLAAPGDLTRHGEIHLRPGEVETVDRELSLAGKQLAGEVRLQGDRRLARPFGADDTAGRGGGVDLPALARGLRRRQRRIHFEMRLPGEELCRIELDPTGFRVPVEAAGDLVDEHRFVIGILDVEIARSESELPARLIEIAVRIEAEVKLRGDRHIEIEAEIAETADEHDLVERDVLQVEVETAVAAGSPVRPARRPASVR